MKNILVTGGAGFIGSHLVDALVARGCRVVVVDNLSTGNRRNINPKAVFYKEDIRSTKLGLIFNKEKPEVVFHYAAQIDLQRSIENPIEDAKENILGSLNVLENSRIHGVKKIIFASTGGAIYGETRIIPTPETHAAHPLSPYGISKLSVEHYLHYYFSTFKIPFVALRFANVYGPRQNPKAETGVVAIFSNAMITQRQPIIFGNGKQTRDFVFIDDVVDASIRAWKSKEKGIFNVGTGKETTINTLFTMLSRLTQAKVKPLYGPARKGEQTRSCLSYAKIKREMGWEPKFDLEKGLQKTIDFFRQHPL